MFCSECATKVVENALFCHHCGAQAAQSSKSDPSHASTSSGVKNTKNSINTGGPKALSAGSGPPIMTFHEFRGRKETERRSHFTSKSGSKKRKTEEKANQERTANMKIGLVTYREELCELKIVRGGNHTVSIPCSIGTKELIAKAVKKHSRFNRSISDRADEYYLLYPDLTRVDKIPGSEEDFSLHRYKKELGKPYELITLYLCKVMDFFVNLTNESFVSEIVEDTDSDSEVLNQIFIV